MRRLLLPLAVSISPLAWSQTVLLTEHSTLYSKERDIARRFFADDIREADELGAASGPLVMDIAVFDLNSDGENEIIGRLLHSSTCGSHGCTFFILCRVNGVWTDIASAIVEPSSRLTIGNEVVNGFRSFSLGSSGYVFRFARGKYQ